MRALVRCLLRCLLAAALLAHLALAGLCLASDEHDVAARLLHFPCAHATETRVAAFRAQLLDTADRTVKHAPTTALQPPNTAFTPLLRSFGVQLLPLRSRLSGADNAVLGARGPPCAH